MTTQPTFRRPDPTIKQKRPSYVPADQSERERLIETAERISALKGQEQERTFQRRAVFERRASPQPQERPLLELPSEPDIGGLTTLGRTLGLGSKALQAESSFSPFSISRPDQPGVTPRTPAQDPSRIFGVEQAEPVGFRETFSREGFEKLIEASEQQPFANQALSGLTSPLNLVPGVGFTPLPKVGARVAARGVQAGREALEEAAPVISRTAQELATSEVGALGKGKPKLPKPGAESAVARGGREPAAPTGLAGAPEPPAVARAPQVQPPSAAPAGAPPTPPQATTPPVRETLSLQKATPPPQKPPKPPTATGALPPEQPPYKVPGEPVEPVPQPPVRPNNVLGLRPMEPGLSRMERVWNVLTPKLRGIPDDPIANPALHERARVKPIIESQSKVVAMTNYERLRKAYVFDKQGGIPSLAGIDPRVPGAPSIQDIAARLPLYADNLTPNQMRALTALRDDLAQWRGLLDDVGVEVRSRADVMDGGFYIPRGRATPDGYDAPIKIGAGFGGRGGKKGFERAAVFDSQSEGVAKGFEYPPLFDALEGYVRDAGTRATDQHVVNYFRGIRDEAGELLGQTPKMRLLEENPAIAKEMEALRVEVTRLRSLRGSLTDRQNAIVDDFLYGTFDDVDEFERALQGLTVQRGKSAGQDIREVAQELKAVKERAAQFRPTYKHAMDRALTTPRDQGAIGLSGLQGLTFPDAIANAANKVLRREGKVMGPGSEFVDLMKTINQFGRATLLTLDNSAPGIQGLLAAYRTPKNFGKALSINLRAWADPNVLSSYMALFDQKRGAAAGRLSLQDWAKHTLHIGGGTAEFLYEQPGRLEGIGRLPVLREANRAFSFFGDALRINLADDFLREEMRTGKTLQQLIESGEVERIAAIVNNMTGWSRRRLGGNVGELTMLAPRFMQARLETITRAGIGTARGLGTVATAGRVKGVGATLDQRIARRSLLQMMAVGTLLTVGANEVRGKETDFNPISRTRDGKIIKNPNFMKVLDVAGRDWSLFGPWDTILGLTIGLAGGAFQGNPGAFIEVMRSVGSTVVRDGWDLVTGRDFNYEPTRDNIPHFLRWLAVSHAPIPIGGTVQELSEGVPPEAALAGAVGDILAGAKSSPLTAAERGEGQTGGGTPVDIRSRIRDARNKAQQRTNTRDAIRKARQRALAGAR